VYWQIGSSATLGTGTRFQGNLMAHDSITMNTNANILTGRAMALGAAVTLDNNVVSPPVGACTTGAVATPTPTPTPSTTSTVPVPPTGAGSPGWILPILGLGLIVGGLSVALGRRRSNRQPPGPV
jgi:type VI secretion system secreted protein VgrG